MTENEFLTPSVVELYIGTSDMSVHCPFCGCPTGAAFEPCEHLLYIIVEGIFMELSTRFMNAAGLESYLDDRWEIPWGELENRGGAAGIALGVRIFNHVQFSLQTANDVIRVGFSDVADDADKRLPNKSR